MSRSSHHIIRTGFVSLGESILTEAMAVVLAAGLFGEKTDPLFQISPAATVVEFAQANGRPAKASFREWGRSLDGGTLTQSLDASCVPAGAGDLIRLYHKPEPELVWPGTRVVFGRETAGVWRKRSHGKDI